MTGEWSASIQPVHHRWRGHLDDFSSLTACLEYFGTCSLPSQTIVWEFLLISWLDRLIFGACVPFHRLFQILRILFHNIGRYLNHSPNHTMHFQCSSYSSLASPLKIQLPTSRGLHTSKDSISETIPQPDLATFFQTFSSYALFSLYTMLNTYRFLTWLLGY